MPVTLYRPRRPRASPRLQCLSAHRKTFHEQYGARFEKREGRLRPEVARTLDAFEACGDLSRGFARRHCEHCGRDYLIAFSCKQRYFCPSCHQKKVQQFGEFIRHEVAQKVPHRQIVVTIPKRLRKAFQFDRQLFTSLCQAAWLSLRDVIRIRLGTPAGQPGVVIAIQTFGDYLNYHPHLHILITDGAFVGTHTFHALHRGDWEQVAELLRARVLKFFAKQGKLSAQEAEKMRQWHHSGFGIHAGHRIQRDDHDGLENLAQYILRNPFSLEKMTYLPETGDVVYCSKRNHATKRLWETFDGPAFIAAIARHIPSPGQHLVRYYGAYSNRARGERRKRANNESPPSAAETPLPTRRSYADFASEREAKTLELRARAFDQGRPLKPHPDAYTPPPKRESGDPIEIIELPRDAMPRIPRKKWRELILKVWEVDPLICPVCARLMRVAGILEDPAKAAALLKTLGWHAYATDSQGARAPPPTADREALELPFASFLDGIVYELEPWEQARQERLADYARERDDLAGIIVLDGEWNDSSDSPSEHDASRQDFEVSQETSFPDDFDQRPPPQWEEDQSDQRPDAYATLPQMRADPDIDQSTAENEQQWDQAPESWSDTPLGQWAIEANRWDGIDPIPQEDEPVFYAD